MLWTLVEWLRSWYRFKLRDDHDDPEHPIEDDNTYQMIVNVKVGPMNGKYQGTISILDQEIPKSYRLIAEGKGSLGFARGSALVTLSDLSDTTSLLVDGEMEIGGTVARIGQRIIGTVSKTMMDRFFECLTQSILNDSMAN